MEWETDHWRLERRRLKRIATTPEQIGLCGCWQVIAVRRERIHLGSGSDESSDEISCYASSAAYDEYNDDQLLTAIRDHWSAIENGVHYRRDVSFNEDNCRIAHRSAAHAMASLRNLALGLYELQKNKGRVTTNSCKSWSRQMTVSKALSMLRS